MKIAFIARSNALDIHSWSGTIHHMFTTLQKSGLEVMPIDDLFMLSKRNPYYYLKRIVYKYLFHQNYLSQKAPAVSRFYAWQIERKIKNMGIDLIISADTALVAHLKGSIPIVIWNDATFAALSGYHPFLRNLCGESLLDGNAAEQTTFDKASLLVFSSQWASRSALKDYQADPAKVVVLPFGANLECNRTAETVLADAKKKSREVCKLLFIGTYWKSKGGDIALETARIMKTRDMNVELHVVGCTPPEKMPDWVKMHGFISKSTPEGRHKIEELFRTSHFLIVPTRADAYGLVFAEACSYGIPSIGTETGGVSEIIKNGVNGMLFGMDDPPERYANWMEKMWHSEEKYMTLATQAFAEYEKRLNWTVVGSQIKELLLNIHSLSPP